MKEVLLMDVVLNQWGEIGTGGMWSDDLVWVLIPAAEFWMICSLLMCLVETSVRRVSAVINTGCDHGPGFPHWIGTMNGGSLEVL